jgi:hypothetical protein
MGMKELEFESKLENQKKVMVVMFWVNRKAARTEGCAPFLIKKITTSKNVYQPEGTSLLKVDDGLMDEMVADLDKGEAVKFEFNIGKEYINANLSPENFCVSVTKSPEIEEEIIEKLEMELQKKFPSLCDSFSPRVTPHK